MAMLAVLVAIATEVAATLALRSGIGLSRPVPTLIVVLGYGTAFTLLAYALRTLPVGPVYAIWSGLGTVGAAVGGVLLFKERLTPTIIVGIALVVLGVVVLNIGVAGADR